MRKFGLALVGAAALAFSTAGNAQLTIIDTEEQNTTVTYGTPTQTGLTFNVGYHDNTLANPFTETLFFQTGASGTVTVTLISQLASVDFTSVLLTGTDVNGPIAGIPLMIGTAFGGFEGAGLTTNLLAGTYQLTIQGNAPNGGAFGGGVSMSAVPEPATWAMLLVGFGAVGSQLRRRRVRMKVQYA